MGKRDSVCGLNRKGRGVFAQGWVRRGNTCVWERNAQIQTKLPHNVAEQQAERAEQEDLVDGIRSML